MVYLYNKQFPSVNDIVKARIEKISTLGIEVTLPEYDNLDGYITYSEVSRKRNFNINKIFTVGHDINLVVINVDHIKKYIDLSKKSISDNESNLFNEKHKKYMTLYNMWKFIYQKYYNINGNDINTSDLELFLKKTLWKLSTLKKDDNEYIYNTCINSESNNDIIELLKIDVLDDNLDYNKIKVLLDEYIRIKINVSKPSKEITIKLLSFAENGLDDIKQVLDYKNYYFYNDIKDDFSLEILYQVNSKYRIIIKQNDFIITNVNYNIDIIEEKVIEVINNNNTEKCVLFSIETPGT
jgi:translation initiation factor 2 alpha subunit (eIF-2alpha)